MRRTGRSRTVAMGVTCLIVGGAFGPPLAAFASSKFQEVVIMNTSEDPVLTKAVGPTDVHGTVTLARGITISGTEGDRPLPVTPVGRTEVGGVVGLADDAKVALADGTKVGLTDGTKVLVDQPIQLADDASVKIDNDDSAPVPVKVVEGGDSPGAQTPASFSTRLDFERGQTFVQSRQREFTVPDGKMFVITGGYGNVSDGVNDVGISRQSVLCSAGPHDGGGFFLGTINGSNWVLHGEPRITAGCPLLVFSNRDSDSAGGTGFVSYHVFGYLTDA